jgi:hypothetical protein
MGYSMTLRDLSLSDWMRMSEELAWRECEVLAQALPHRAAFNGINAHSYCGREHRIARFRIGDGERAAEFVLVPGGEAPLGFDGRNFSPSEQQMASFADSAEEYGIDQSIQEFVEGQTSAPRVVQIAAILLEVEAREVGAEPVDSNDPAYSELHSRLEGKGPIRMEYSGGSLDGFIIERSPEGTCRAWRRRTTTSGEVEAALAAQGMRLPTCDEWEWACGAGAATLFRWGNDTPADFYPGETSAEDRQQNAAWALSGGRLTFSHHPLAVWDIHERANLLGLRIAMNPYQVDLVADGPRTLGGDGGCNICGGVGFFLGWLPLATAFRDPGGGFWSAPETNVADSYCRVRRVISIP